MINKLKKISLSRSLSAQRRLYGAEKQQKQQQQLTAKSKQTNEQFINTRNAALMGRDNNTMTVLQKGCRATHGRTLIREGLLACWC